MTSLFCRKNFILPRKLISVFIVITFGLSTLVVPATSSSAQLLPNLPAPGQMLWLSSGFMPPVLKGMTVHAENPLLFDFIVDRGQDKINNDLLKEESTKLIKYFLASMTIPDKDAWVNLSPYEKNRIIPEALGQTEMGRQMLEQDYILKQLSASLTNPDKELGQKFWKEVKARAQKQFGTAEVPLNTFNKVWIVPNGATVVEKDGFAFITDSQLKVMLDEDYVSLSNQKDNAQSVAAINDPARDGVSKLSTAVFRELILPQLVKEVNEGKNFAPTRQVYQSVILAAWYKKALKDSLLGRIYADKSKIQGVESDVQDIKQKVYDQYLDAFKKGAYNVIKEDSTDSEAVPRKYFSGGLQLGMNLNPDQLKVLRGSSAVNQVAAQINAAGDQIALVASSATESKEEQALQVSSSTASSGIEESDDEIPNAPSPPARKKVQAAPVSEEAMLRAADWITNIYKVVYKRIGKKYLDPFGNPLATSPEFGTFAPSSLRATFPTLNQFGVGPGKKFVDLGSGDGRVALAAAFLGATGIGVEKDPQLVTIAKQAFARVAMEINVPWSVGFIRSDISEYSLQGPNAPDVLYYYQGGGAEIDQAVRNKIMAGTTNPNAILIVSGFAKEYDLFPELERITTPDFEEQNWTAVYKVPVASSGITVTIPTLSPFKLISVLQENLGLRINYLGNGVIEITGISDSSRFERIHDNAMRMIADGRRGFLQSKIFSEFSADFQGRARNELEIQKDAHLAAIALILDSMAAIKPLTAPVTAGGLNLKIQKITEYNEDDLQFLSVVVDRIAEQQKQIDPAVKNITSVGIAPLPKSQDGLTTFSLITFGEKQFVVKSRRENTLGREVHLENQYQVMQKVNANGGHPSIAPVIDFGNENGRTYLVTGFVPGKDLSQVVNLPRLNVTLDKVVDFAVKFAEAVKFVHDQGVVIRDLNPHNVRIASDGTVGLFDFDASMPVSYDWGKDLSSLRYLRGADYYSDGFYLDPGKTPDFQLDIAQIGVDLFYFAEGYYPIDEDTNFRDQLPLQRLDEFPGLRKIIERTVASRENGRYKNVDELLTDLRALQSSLKTEGRSSASSSVFGDEDNLSRGLYAMENAYQISSYLDQRKAQEKVRLLLVGVGRGISAMQLALKYPNLEIVAVNSQRGMWFENKAAAMAAKLDGKVYSAAQLSNAFDRIKVVEPLDIEDTSARNVMLSEFADSDGRFDMVFFETNVTMYLQDQVRTIEALFNERVKVGGVYGFEIWTDKSAADARKLMTAGLSSAFAQSGKVINLDPTDPTPKFLTVERTKNDAVKVLLRKVDAVRYRPGVIADFNQPVYSPEYEVVASGDAAQETRASSVLSEQYNRPGDKVLPSDNSSWTFEDLARRAREIFALVDLESRRMDNLFTERDAFVLREFMGVRDGKYSQSDELFQLALALERGENFNENIADLTGEGVMRLLYAKGLIRNLREKREYSLVEPFDVKVEISVPDIYDPLKKTASRLAQVVKQYQAYSHLAELRSTLLGHFIADDSKLYLLAAAGVPDIGPTLRSIYEELLKGPRAKYAANDFMQILRYAEQDVQSASSGLVEEDFNRVAFKTIDAVVDPSAFDNDLDKRLAAFFIKMLLNRALAQDPENPQAVDSISEITLQTMWADMGLPKYSSEYPRVLALYNKLGMTTVKDTKIKNLRGENPVIVVFPNLLVAEIQKGLEELKSIEKNRGSLESLEQILLLTAFTTVISRFKERTGKRPASLTVASRFLVGVANRRWLSSKVLNDFRRIDQKEFETLKARFIVEQNQPSTTFEDMISFFDIHEENGQYVIPEELARDLIATMEDNRTMISAFDGAVGSSGVIDGDFIARELDSVVNRIMAKLNFSGTEDVAMAVKEGLDFIALESWWRGEAGWFKEVIAADGSKVLVLAQVPLNNLIVKHLKRYADSAPAFNEMGVRDVQGQITVSPEFVKIVNDEVLYSASGAQGKPAASSGVFNNEGFVVPTKIPFREMETVEAFTRIIGGNFFSVNYGRLRGHEITIFWDSGNAGERIKTYIVQGDYRNRLPEALQLFEAKTTDHLQSRYAGFDPLRGKDYTVHDYYPGQFTEPQWTWFQEGNTVGKSEAEIIAAHDKSLSTASSAVGGINFDPTLLNLQIKRDGRGVPLPLPQQNLENININGLYPVIINIKPVNAQTLPLLGQLQTAPDIALSKG